MSVLLATLCLNEMEWLPRLVAQHRDWPGLARWVFVEAADAAYVAASPHLVTADGLSVDGTTEFLQALAAADDRVVYVRYGPSRHADPAAGKAPARQQYLDVAEEVRPEFVVVLDADEFYTRDDQALLAPFLRAHPAHAGFTLPRREVWRPPAVAHDPLFAREAVGGFWGIPCCHWWRWQPGVCYSDCHNTPRAGRSGRPLNATLAQFHNSAAGVPQLVHLGYAAARPTRLAKNAYYAGRGEATDRQRRWYVESRAAWDRWVPGATLPFGAKVVPYGGPVPECFRGEEGGENAPPPTSSSHSPPGA